MDFAGDPFRDFPLFDPHLNHFRSGRFPGYPDAVI